MSSADENIKTLRDAVRVSPNNLPLRIHLAKTLIGLGYLEDAEKEYREALAIAPNDVETKIGYAEISLKQDKISQGLVVIEDVCQGNAPAAAYVLYAKLLQRDGKIPDAVAQYKLGLELDPDVADDDLGVQLGVGDEYEDSDVFEGKIRERVEPGENAFETEVERPRSKI